jgi:hypothetical protein
MYDSELPAWKSATRVLTIKNIHYDHLNQRQHVDNPKEMSMRPVTLRNCEDLYLQLRAKYGLGLLIGDKPEAYLMSRGANNDKKRKLCDVCYVICKPPQLFIYIHTTVTYTARP